MAVAGHEPPVAQLSTILKYQRLPIALVRAKRSFRRRPNQGVPVGAVYVRFGCAP